MGGGYKVDIVASPFTELPHHDGHLFRRHLHPFCQMTDLVVLAKAAKQIAGADKNGTRSVLPNQGGLFSKMGGIAGNGGLPSCLAVTQFPVQAIYAT